MRCSVFLTFLTVAGLFSATATVWGQASDSARAPDLFVVGPGINDDGSELRKVAEKLARPNSVVVNLRQAEGITANDMSKLLASGYREAQKQGADLVVVVDMDLEDFSVVTDYPMSRDRPRWDQATTWGAESLSTVANEITRLNPSGLSFVFGHSAFAEAVQKHIVAARHAGFDYIEILMGRARAQQFVFAAGDKGYSVEREHVHRPELAWQPKEAHSWLTNNPDVPVAFDRPVGGRTTQSFLDRLRSTLADLRSGALVGPVARITTITGDAASIGGLAEQRAVRGAIDRYQALKANRQISARVGLSDSTTTAEIRWHNRRFRVVLPEKVFKILKSGKNVLARLRTVGKVTYVVLYVDGLPHWEIVVDDADQVVAQHEASDGSGTGEVTVPLSEDLSRRPTIRRLPPPPGPPGAEAAIGGVLLCDTAVVKGANSEQIGAMLLTPSVGEFCLLLDGEGRTVSEAEYRKFITALWSVYFGSEDPGISIDTISPDSDVQLVRLIGNIYGTALAKTLLDADYLMKQAAIGKNGLNVAGFKSVDELTGRTGLRYLGAYRRFWFVPEDMVFRKCGSAVLFESGRMTLKTEYVFLQGKHGRSEPADEAFAKFWTEHYDKIAKQHPVYHELFNYAKMVALAKYLKESGLGLQTFLLSRRHSILTDDLPGTVPTLRSPSRVLKGAYWSGGVDLGINMSASSKGRYILDEKGAAAMARAVASLDQQVPLGTLSNMDAAGSSLNALSVTVKDSSRALTVVPARALKANAPDGVVFHTDLAMRVNGQPGPELCRYFVPGRRTTGAFGNGWDLYVPYRLQPADGERTQYANAQLPVYMEVIDLLEDSSETLVFDAKRFGVAAWVPVEPNLSRFLGLAILSDGSFRLFEKTGAQFGFDPAGRLNEIRFSETVGIHLDYVGSKVASARDDKGVRISFVYDAGKIVRADSPVGPIVYEYLGNDLTRVTTPASPSTYLIYSPAGELTDVIVRR